jgi:predicted glycosyltransferase involved in capsule biosynthesis
MKNKLLIIVPYRNREKHLLEFIKYIIPAITQQNIKAKIVIVEQDDTNPFNRGLLCNVGFHHFYKDFDYVCFHDVDMIGDPFDYSYEEIPTLLSSLKKMPDGSFQDSYKNYFGGVILFPNNLFLKINGFSNVYWGWGCEDDDLYLRCYSFRVKTQKKPCKYYTLQHKKNFELISYKKNYSTLIFQYKLPKDQKLKSFSSNGISNINNYIDSLFIKNQDIYTIVKIKTKYLKTKSTQI